ncbi:TetR/AcrR family transcriptional regulator [Neomicrococcus aestuarii]|uniref:AcrR family transcriptional regulator n=1 Tax=Neomicrococcus aestuarii TaxID=556325 RepID=A0A1L2ZN08_9MICC|nr:TetR/AcrR family transcriptional regulator C-terminal domain-containing protein [Neomicrococcus aestuarii]APF40580.1 hypothetical protein BHE16_05615 [Neomicrococcus aestuarii]MBB5512271.1 AcrR family transcriptional regulator [Neomicrococcus aestuarii]
MNKPPSEAVRTAAEGQDFETTDLASRRKSSRGRLDLGLILRTGAELIEDESIHQLSMRNLAARLGVQAMSLYRYVPSRDVLIDGIVELVLEDLESNPEVHKEATEGWESFVRRLSHGFRKVAQEHPQVFPVIATRPPEAPWIRPPMRSLTWINRFLQALRESGFSEEATVRAYRAYSSFLLGHLLLELAGADVDISDVGPESGSCGAHDDARGSDLSEYPFIEELEPKLRENHAGEEFERALDRTISYIAQLKDA